MSRANMNFENTLEKLARILSKNYGCEVRIEGNKACTDGKTIWLPMLEDVSDELKADLDAFLDHEVAHVKFTDFDELNRPKRLVNRFHLELFNAIEDSRIEELMVREYPGTAFNLDRLNEKWGSLMQDKRTEMPWPIRLVIAIREVYDNKLPKVDKQIEPIMAAILPQCKALRKARNSKELLDATAELIKAINAARELLAKGLPPVPDEELENACKELRGETPIQLDPNRKDKKGKEAKGQEQYDPATEMKEQEGKDGEPQDSDSGESQDGEQDGESQDGQEGEQQEGGQSGQAGMSAEQQGNEAGGGESQDSDGADGKSDSDKNESGKGDESDTDGDEDSDGAGKSEEELEAEREAAEAKAERERLDKAEQERLARQRERDAAADEAKRNKRVETHESVTGDEGDDSKDLEAQDTGKNAGQKQKYDGTHEIETRKNYATWKDTAKEEQMLKDSVNAKSEFDNHVFSPESYMEIQLEKAVSSEPKVRDSEHGYYYGREGKINPKHVSLPYSRAYDEVIDYTGEGDREAYFTRKRKSMKHINPIKAHLERTLKVKENARITPERERGQLNTRSLAQLCINKNYRTPFKQYTKEDTTNVAVTLLIDCSGSMGGDKIEVARQTALGLAEALKAIGINFEVLGFNTSSNSTLASKVRSLNASETARFNRFGETLRLMIFKRFDSQDLTGIVKAEAGGANADGESIIWAAKRLAMREEKRKILIVLSDGQPSYGGANHDVLAGDLKRTISILPKSGIEPIGIGIMTDDPKLFYDDWLEVNDLSKLSTTVMAKLSKMLEKGMK
jgi:cobalamin biosynthesis protein CobT